jgi:hypothetical protein
MPSIRQMGKNFAADRKITREEAQALVNKAKENGVVTKAEKKALTAIMTQYKDLFDPAALETLKALVGGTTPPPAPSGTTIPLSETGAARPVFVAPDGSFVTSAGSASPRDNVELGDGVFRAAELVDDAKKNPFAALSADTRGKIFDKLTAALGKAPAGGANAPGLDDVQTKQLRASSASALLGLIEATPEAALQKTMVDAYASLIKKETIPQLRESLIFNLHGSEASRTGETKKISDEFMRELAPLQPPYEKWFKNGNKTVNLDWTVGEGEFKKGFTNKLKEAGFKPVGEESPYGKTTYEKTVNKPGVGETTFRITVGEGGSNMMSSVGNDKVQIFGYDGHSNWGRNISSSVKNAPPAANGGDGQLFFYNMCVGKSGLDKVKDKFPNLQTVTTYAASNFYTDGNGQMTTGEGVQSLLAMVDNIADRAPWTTIHRDMNRAANIGWGRTWDNYVTPISTMTREKVLDRDNDGQSDYMDRLYNFNTFRPAEDTRREFAPIKQDRQASVLDGTKALMSGNMINTISEFSGIMDRVNPDSKVVSGGFFEPKDSERELVKFEKVNGRDGKPEYHMKWNARYSHMSEDAMRSVAAFEFNRYLYQTNQLNADPVDAKINGLVLAAHSLSIDEGYRDQEIWDSFLKRYNLPPMDLSRINSLKSEDHHHYAGSEELVRKIRAELTPAVIEALKAPTAGEPSAVG